MSTPIFSGNYIRSYPRRPSEGRRTPDDRGRREALDEGRAGGGRAESLRRCLGADVGRLTPMADDGLSCEWSTEDRPPRH